MSDPDKPYGMWDGSGAYSRTNIDWAEATRKADEAIAKRRAAHLKSIADRKAERERLKAEAKKPLPVDYPWLKPGWKG